MNTSKIIMREYQEDLPTEVVDNLGAEVAIDTEAMGLNLNRDRLCIVQLKGIDDDTVHIVKFGGKNYKGVNLIRLLNNDKVLKVYHYGRFDIAIMLKFLGALSNNNYCTKIASFLARTYTNKHGLKDLCHELLNINLNKNSQSSYWGEELLTDAQKTYIANDVLHLSSIKVVLDKILTKEKRMPLAKSCFGFLGSRALLDVLGWNDVDLFSHSINKS